MIFNKACTERRECIKMNKINCLNRDFNKIYKMDKIDNIMEKPYLHTANLSSTRNATQPSTLLHYFSLNKVIRLGFLVDVLLLRLFCCFNEVKIRLLMNRINNHTNQFNHAKITVQTIYKMDKIDNIMEKPYLHTDNLSSMDTHTAFNLITLLLIYGMRLSQKAIYLTARCAKAPFCSPKMGERRQERKVLILKYLFIATFAKNLSVLALKKTFKTSSPNSQFSIRNSQFSIQIF